MKKHIILLLVAAFPILALAQTKKFEYTPKVKGKIEITNLPGEISLLNSNGNAIVIESDFNMEKPERADGLKLLGSAEDNTDLGVNISEENGIIHIQGATRQVKEYKYKVLVPVGMAVNLNYSSPFAKGGDITVEGFNGSLELKTLNANVKISKSSGPFTIATISGNIEIRFDKINQAEPTSLASISGLIDISVPSSEKASFDINTMNGNVYNNLDLNSVQKKESDDKENRAHGMNYLKMQSANSYTLNGGGQKVLLKSITGNIYLRKL
jgi:lia operon protein LiaG